MREVSRVRGREDEDGTVIAPTIKEQAWRMSTQKDWGASRGGSKIMSRGIREAGRSRVSRGKEQPQCQHAGQVKYN